MKGLIVSNATVITMNPKQPRASNVVVEGNRIALVGSETDLPRYRHAGYDLLDARGHTVLPGFIDSHLHLMWMGRSMLFPPLDLSGVNTIGHVTKLLYERVKSSSPGQWITAIKLDEDNLAERRPLSRADLDTVSPFNPVIVRKAIEHSLVANSAALAKAGITGNTADPHGGKIEKDTGGMPTGTLSESAMKLVDQVMPRPTRAEERAALALALRHVCSFGFTSVVSNDDFPSPTDPLQLLSDLDDFGAQNGWAVRVTLEPDISRADQLIAQADLFGRFSFGRIGPLKIFADGALFTRTAALEEDYADDPGNKGIECFSASELESLIINAQIKGFSVAVHAIGDKSIKHVILAIEKARRICPGSNTRHRIIHCSIINPEYRAKMSELEIIADWQPTFLLNEWKWVPGRLGKQRTKWAYLGRSFFDSGVRVIAGSDAPSEPVNPFPAIYAAITRQDPAGAPPEGWKPEERLTVEEVLRAYTAEGAYATFEEKTKGTLEPGKLADLIIVDRNPLESSPSEILHARCLITVAGGRIAWHSGDFPG